MTRNPVTVSIIIPSLNEAEEIGASLASALRQTHPIEVIVVDGGSTDETPEIAARYGVTVIRVERGRACQMNAGAEIARGEILLFLHADTRLPENAVDAIRATLANPGAVSGCFRTTFDDASNLWMQLWQARIWMRWHRLAFGDRALFIQRTAFDTFNGFPDQPIFEDLELVRRARRTGRFVFLKANVVTSARRFRENGALVQQLRNLALWIGWNLRLPPGWFKPFYPDRIRTE